MKKELTDLDKAKIKRVQQHWKFPVFLLSIGAFLLGLIEFVVTGIGKEVVQTYHVTASQTELMITIYAIGVVVGGPIATLFSDKFYRNQLLLVTFLNFALGNFIVIIAPSNAYWLVLVGRFDTSISMGLFFSIASSIVVGIAPKDKSSRSLSQLFNGFTISAAVGAPLGILLATSVKGLSIASWKIIFIVIIIISLVMAVSFFFIIPKKIESQGEKATVRENLAVTKDRNIWVILIPSVLIAMSIFFVYPNAQFILTAPLKVGSVINGASASIHYGILNSDEFLWLVMAAFGVMMTIGNNIGGRIISKSIFPNLYYAIGLSIILPLLMMATMFTSFGGLTPQIFNMIFVLLIGFASWLRTSGMTLNVLRYAQSKHSNKINFIASLNMSAFNLGITLGSLGGTYIFDNNYSNLKWVLIPTALLALIALPFIFNIDRLFKKLNINKVEDISIEIAENKFVD